MAATALISIFVININYSQREREREMAQILNRNQGQLDSTVIFIVVFFLLKLYIFYLILNLFVLFHGQ